MRIIDKLYAESWNIAFREAAEGTILSDQTCPFRVIKNPLRYWAADPFIFEKDGKTYLFAELYDYFTNKGVIGCTELTEQGINGWQIIIKELWHLSYPFVFEHNREVYIMPEMNDGNGIWIYKATNFPYEWKKENVILDHVKYVDTTLVERKNGFVAYAQDSNGNPIVFFISSKLVFEKYGDYEGAEGCLARPGGRFFTKDTDCYAVCQDCSQTYGGALCFYNAEVSDNTIRLHNVVKHLQPKDIALDRVVRMNGIHTYTATTRFEVIDIKTSRFSLLNLFGRIHLHMKGKKDE